MSDEESVEATGDEDADFIGLFTADEGGDGDGSADETDDSASDEDDRAEEVEASADGGTDEDADDAKDDEERDEERPDPRDRLVQKLARRERELTQERRRVRELEGRLGSLPDVGREYLGDRIGAVRGLVATALGAKDVEDPRVAAELNELIEDLMLETAGPELLQAQPELARRREERTRESRRRSAEADVRRRMDDLEAREMRIRAAEGERQALTELDGMVRTSAKEYPVLASLTDEDYRGGAPRLVYEGLMLRYEAGERPETREEAVEMAREVMKNLERHYREQARKVNAALGRGADDGGLDDDDGEAPTQTRRQERTDDRRPKERRRAGGRTITSRGASTGGRGSAPPREGTILSEEAAFNEFWNKPEPSRRRR